MVDRSALILCALFTVNACASIVGDTDQLVGINSEPSQARVNIIDENGVTVFSGQTPTTVNLNKSDGYFDGMDYTVQISKDGYDDQVLPVTTGPNAWYIIGNLGFGGIIGWFIIDPATGAMWKLSPENVTANLSPNETNQQSSTPSYPRPGNENVVLARAREQSVESLIPFNQHAQDVEFGIMWEGCRDERLSEFFA